MPISYNEFHISKAVRDKCNFSQSLYSSTGNVIITSLQGVRIFTERLNKYFDSLGMSEKRVSAGQINAMGLIDEILHYVSMLYRRDGIKSSFEGALSALDEKFGREKIDEMLKNFCEEFPPTAVYRGEVGVEEYLSLSAIDSGTGFERTNREAAFEELMMLHLANENPAFKPFSILFNDLHLRKNPIYMEAWEETEKYFKTQKKFGPFNNDFITFLREPMNFSPKSLRGQLQYILKHWMALIGEWLKKRLLASLDTLSEEEKAAWHPTTGGEVNMEPYNYDNLMNEYERFSPDRDWMPKVVLMAKTILVWLDQLTKKYGYPITRLDQIPDAELDALRDEGFTGLWLIGLWERSNASKRIKQICGNPEAASSAYSLMDYTIAGNLGGWEAVDNLRRRLWVRGIRLASDMVPNHTAMDSRWIVERPDLFVQRRDNPFPQYSYNGENLSYDGRVGVYLEDHYYSKSDCAVVFKRVDNATGDTRYIYHGNDGTGMPWNDTAQIDFLNPEAREAVMQEILHVARNFPIIRFDAAMVLAKKHIRRLWYPEPGHGGDIATRSESAISSADFEAAIPNEFWREVVDRVAQEVPDTLLLAEAFWMMEGYFVRTLGMHRVYNSAFMNMLKKEENQKYRDTVKNTIKFDPEILKRYVNFMNNPDEETAVAQFGKGDKYFGVCTLMVTMPGLPMFGHGQLEGFEEKYGMEYTRAYRDEKPDEDLMNRHRHDIFPLMHKRYLFAQVEDFLFYDVWDNGRVNENVFAYSNRSGDEYAVVFYNNKYERASGWIKQSCEYAVKFGEDKAMKSRSISEGLGLTAEDDKFLIFREHRSGLWFVRKCADICQSGMFISLNGFECQIMLDIHQVSDTLDKKWSTLCSVLNGRGCYDLEVEWEEYRYHKLYIALEKFAGGDFFAKANAVFAKPSADAAKKFLDGVKKSGIEFYKTAAIFAEEDAKIFGMKLGKKTAEKQFAGFEKSFKEILKMISAKKSASSKSAKTLDKAKSKVEFILAGKMQKFTENEILVASAIALSLNEKSFSTRWSLDRKFCEYMRSAGLEIPEARDILYRAFLLTKLALPKLDAKNQKKAALAFANFVCESSDAPALSRANEFDNVVWFNKEELARTLFLAAQNEFVEGANGEKEILSLYKTLFDAQEKAEYKCLNFIEAFAEKKKSVAKKANAKSVAKATSAAKKAATKSPAKTSSAAEKKAGEKSPAKKSATKTKAEVKKVAPKKAAAAKATAKKASEKTSTAKKASAKAASKKDATTKTAAKKAGEKNATGKTAAKKPSAKTATKTSASATKKAETDKKVVAKKSVAEKKPASSKTAASVKKTTVAEKTSAKVASEKSAVVKKAASKTATKSVEKKASSKASASATKKTAEKKATTKGATEKKAGTKSVTKNTASVKKVAADKKASSAKKSVASNSTTKKAKKEK
ncbi:MAG: alpha-amylase [Treponemataceae bacterium]|nr:alpha-amylase [Treponemataceae bacterium]